MNIQQITSKTEKITPQMCEQWLATNKSNRRINRRIIEDYKRDIIAQKWEINGETIGIDWNGDLVNGQHRCIAGLESGIDFYSIVVRGLNPDVIHTIDTGKKRSFADRLYMTGVPNSTAVAATLKTLANLAFSQSKIKSLTHSEMAKLLKLHPGIIESAALTVKIFPKMATYIGAGHYLIKYLGYPESRADDLLYVWKSGQQTYENDAMVFVREYLIKHQNNELRCSMDFRRRLFNTGLQKFIEMRPMHNSRLSNHSLKINGWTERQLGLSNR
jgi:hypothetical protein